jgi:hypothetical protein
MDLVGKLSEYGPGFGCGIRDRYRLGTVQSDLKLAVNDRYTAVIQSSVHAAIPRIFRFDQRLPGLAISEKLFYHVF